MNKTDLIARMTERLSGDRTAAAAAVNGVLEEIEGSVARGERVSLTGFGTFERRERAARTARNPRTGETVQVGASVVPVFRAGTGFRTLLTEANGGASPAAASSAPAEVAEAPAGDTKKGGTKAREQHTTGKSKAAKGKAGKGKAGKGKEKDKEKGKKKAAKDVRAR